jgi:hypothetical protein
LKVDAGDSGIEQLSPFWSTRTAKDRSSITTQEPPARGALRGSATASETRMQTPQR